MSKFCQSCGAESQPMLQFCLKCGATAFGPAAPPPPYKPPHPTTTAPPGYQPQWHAQAPPGRSVVADLRNPKERVYQVMMLCFGVVGWILIFLGIVGAVTMDQKLLVIVLRYAFYAFLVLLFFLISAAV